MASGIISGEYHVLLMGSAKWESILYLRCVFYRMSISGRCETEKISSLVKQHVAKAKLTQQHEAELTFTLPFESMDTFPGKNQTVSRRKREEQPHNENVEAAAANAAVGSG